MICGAGNAAGGAVKGDLHKVGELPGDEIPCKNIKKKNEKPHPPTISHKVQGRYAK